MHKMKTVFGNKVDGVSNRSCSQITRQLHSNYNLRRTKYRSDIASSEKDSVFPDFSMATIYTNKPRDYYFLSPSRYTRPLAASSSAISDESFYMTQKHFKSSNIPTSPSCTCIRSKSLEDVRTVISSTWKDDTDEYVIKEPYKNSDYSPVENHLGLRKRLCPSRGSMETLNKPLRYKQTFGIANYDVRC